MGGSARCRHPRAPRAPGELASEVTRLEGFSDAVFAFALTLLVVSLEVPKSYAELIEAMKGIVAFGVCFALLAQIWVNHHRYFRRYGLQDGWVVFLNFVLLFVVLIYVYQSLADHVAMALIGLVSVLLALLLPPQWVGLAGYFYFSIGVYFTISGTFFGRKARALARG